MITSTLEVRQWLADPDLPNRLGGLGLRPADAADLHRAATAALDRPEDLETLATVADRIVAQLGDFTAEGHPAVWSGVPLDAEGVLPMLALLVTAPRVADWHARRGIPAEVSAATLSDLGQQAWVHRLAFGTFGLHTHDWLTIAWSGALYWLGRLQFNLQPEDDGWVLSTHIPRTGPLTPESVDRRLRRGQCFLRHLLPGVPGPGVRLLELAPRSCPDRGGPIFQPGRLPAPLAADRAATVRRGRRPVLRLQPPRSDRVRVVAGRHGAAPRHPRPAGLRAGLVDRHRADST